MKHHYYQVFVSNGITNDKFEGNFKDNFENFDDAAEQFKEVVESLTNEVIPVPSKIDDAIYTGGGYSVWVWRIPAFPILTH